MKRKTPYIHTKFEMYLPLMGRIIYSVFALFINALYFYKTKCILTIIKDCFRRGLIGGWIEMTGWPHAFTSHSNYNL